MPRRHIHMITPGDHFSPLTGSAIPTVVHGLASSTSSQGRDGVTVARGTYGQRYESAEVIEYDLPPQRRFDRYADVLAGRLGLPRPGARRSFAAALHEQGNWPEAVVFAHNAPQAIPLVDVRHRPVLYAHNQLLRTYRPREVARTLGGAHAIVCVSEFLAEQTMRQLPRSVHDRVVVVRNGVEDRFSAASRHRPRGDRLHVAFVGRMIRDKGADLLLEAVARLGRTDIDVTLVGADGFAPSAPPTPYEREIARRAAALPRPARLTGFLPRDGVRAVLATADVVVVPSRWADPCPLAMFEGLGVGAAVVGADIGGIPEVIGGAGVLVPPGDAGALGDVLAALAEDETYLRQCQEAGRERAREMTWRHARARLDMALERIGQ